MTDPIDACLERWHQFLRSSDPELLDDLLDDDVVFLSPIVFTPQEGKEITKMYLAAAGTTLGGDGGGFRYVRTIKDGHDALLEFETTVEGKHVNGIDLITCDDDGRIVNFKVMIRPLQAINAVHAQMKAVLEKLG